MKNKLLINKIYRNVTFHIIAVASISLGYVKLNIRESLLFLLIGISIVIALWESFCFSNTMIKKLSYTTRHYLFVIPCIIIELISAYCFKLFYNQDFKLIFNIIIIYIILDIVSVIIRTRDMKNKSNDYNEALVNYKNTLENEGIKCKIMKSSKNAEEKVVMRTIFYINNKPNENLPSSGATYGCVIEKHGFELMTRNILTNKLNKSSLKSLLYREMTNVEILVGNLYENQGVSLFAKHSYENNEKDILFKQLYTLKLIITMNDGVVYKLNTNEIKETFASITQILNENNVKYSDVCDLKTVLEGRTYGELYEYFKENNLDNIKSDRGTIGSSYINELYNNNSKSTD